VRSRELHIAACSKSLFKSFCPIKTFIQQSLSTYSQIELLRCFAPNHDLSSINESRFRKITELLMRNFDDDVLWDVLGFDSGVTVCLICDLCIYEIFISARQPYTSQFSRAHIYEPLSHDILHQFIKGTFKNHLVTWIEDYLKLTHPANGAKRIVNDIDMRYVLVDSVGIFSVWIS
jgi:hypothetical protein